MAKEPIPSRLTLAANLKALLKRHKMSGPALAKKAGVDRKTVNNQLNGRVEPRLDQVDAVARVFGMTASQMLSAHFDPAHDHEAITEIMDIYHGTTDVWRESIFRVAQAAAKHKN